MKVTDQNVPSIHLSTYLTVLREAREIRKSWYTRARGNFRIHPTRRYKIKGLGFVDYDSWGTRKQKIQRERFKASMRCFNAQPKTGGAVPPDIGPRNRSWWFQEALATGLWYVCYMNKVTLDKIAADEQPDWCAGLTSKLIEIQEDYPDYVGDDGNVLAMIDSVEPRNKQGVIVKPADHGILWVNLEMCYMENNARDIIYLVFEHIQEDLVFEDMSWNNTHEYGVEFKRFTLPTRDWYKDIWNTWVRVQCPACKFIKIRIEAPNKAADYEGAVDLTSTGVDHIVGRQPFWSIK